MPIAVSNLTLKAWEAFVAVNGFPGSGEPYFIQLIRHRQRRSKVLKVQSEPSDAFTATPTPLFTDVFSGVEHNTDPLWNTNASMGIPPATQGTAPLDYPDDMEWSTWNSLLVDFQTNNTDVYQPDVSSFNLGI